MLHGGALLFSTSSSTMLRNARGGGGVVVTSGAEPQTVLDELSSEIDRLNKENAVLRQRIQLLTHRLFGRYSEKGVPVVEQGVLPFEPVVARPVQPETTDESSRDETYERAPLRRRHPGRRRLPADLPREQIELVPPACERHCATCDTAKVRIGADTTEELDYVPASFVIREYVRPKYACARCQQGVVQAALPARPIEKGRPGAGSLAHVVTSKYADHLPLYRQEQILERHGVEVTRPTLSEWNGAVADMLEPIVRAMHREQVCRSPWIQCDDTTLDVQDPSRAPEIRTGHIWVYRGELGEVVYDFTWARNRDGPLKTLANYRGYLQVDAAPPMMTCLRSIPRSSKLDVGRTRGDTSKKPCRRQRWCARTRWPSSGSSMGSSGRPPRGSSMPPHASGCARHRRGPSWRRCVCTCRSSRQRRYRRARWPQPSATRCAIGPP